MLSLPLIFTFRVPLAFVIIEPWKLISFQLVDEQIISVFKIVYATDFKIQVSKDR